MNVDTLDSKYKVVSKYFTSTTAMDESLTEFKEKKSLKISKKAPSAKPKVKKVKRVKGQKDIRTVLKGKKNELVAYSEEFHSVCKKSGIDVDSEQLQLAIALSKSLETTESVENPSSSSKTLTTQQRTGLIRTTLKEYGFKVPEKPITNRKVKKRRKPYKLLLTGEEEKQQIITDRYTQVLFQLNNLKTVNISKNLELSNLFLYNMCTNIEYEKIKDDSIFYVENIIEKSSNNMGCLLKNWSDIPGRPSSPVRDKSELLFSEVECSQDELDIVLSGPMNCSKDILQKKSLLCREKSNYFDSVKGHTIGTWKESIPDLIEDCVSNPVSPEVFIVNSGDDIKSPGCCKEPSICLSSSSVVKDGEVDLLVVKQPSRSLSPDLFDDEDDTLVEIPNVTTTVNKINNEPKLATNSDLTKETSEVMDLTECVHIASQRNIENCGYVKPTSQLSQHVDVTKRRSNDFMELTECFATSSQQILERTEEQIDLTGNCEHLVATGQTSVCIENAEIIECVDGSFQASVKVNEHIDLTAFYEKDIETEKNQPCQDNVTVTEDLTDIFLDNKTKNPDAHIDLTGHCSSDAETKNECGNPNKVEQMDLTQSSNTSYSSNDTLPFVYIGGTQAVPEKSLNDTIILNENDYLDKPPDAEMEINDKDIEPLAHAVDSEESPEGDTVKTDNDVINLDETCEVPQVDNDNVDLTQTSDSNEAPDRNSNNSHPINNSSLGKKDDVSVDYDVALENMNSLPYYSHDDNYDNNTIQTDDHPQKFNTEEIHSTSKQDILELSDNDNELDSSTKTKNVENHFDFGGISVIENLHSFNRKSRNILSSIPNASLSDSLPMVNVKGSGDEKSKSVFTVDPVLNPIDCKINENYSNTDPKTPQTKVNRELCVETPEHSEYIVKTDNVTPILDYASMSTPERNRELDKYGLKPFKRKRAIQLLTHLYNQTHPYVESTEELKSPCKKRKTDNFSQPSCSKICNTQSITPKKISSPRKCSRSPRKASRSPSQCSRSPRQCSKSPKKIGNELGLSDTDKENELFSLTREVPLIRNVECDADDWVFQKREKAKLHTCRVPLHIAFHNYVSCRSRLHEAILRYEPVNIDVIHKQLAGSGHRYDPKDLLKFLDKRCITVKTADGTKNNRRY